MTGGKDEMMKYTPEFIAYVNKYPVAVIEDYRNGIKDETVFTSKRDALNYIERKQIKGTRTQYTLIENRLNPEYL
jgi:hypothetical protein